MDSMHGNSTKCDAYMDENNVDILQSYSRSNSFSVCPFFFLIVFFLPASNIFFFHNKSANSNFSLNFPDQRTGPPAWNGLELTWKHAFDKLYWTTICSYSSSNIYHLIPYLYLSTSNCILSETWLTLSIY